MPRNTHRFGGSPRQVVAMIGRQMADASVGRLISEAVAANEDHQTRELKAEREREIRTVNTNPVVLKDEVPSTSLGITDDECIALAELPRVVRAERFQKWRRNDKCPRDGCGKLIGNHSLKRFKEHFEIATFGLPLERRVEAVLADREAEAEAARDRARFESMKFPLKISAQDLAAVRGIDRIFGCKVRFVDEPGAPRTVELIGLAGDLIVVTARYEQHGKKTAMPDWYLTRYQDAPVKNEKLVEFREERARELEEERLSDVTLEEVTGSLVPG